MFKNVEGNEETFKNVEGINEENKPKSEYALNLTRQDLVQDKKNKLRGKNGNQDGTNNYFNIGNNKK